MDLNNLNVCKENCTNKCYIELKNGTLARKLCKQAIGRIFNDCNDIIAKKLKELNTTMEELLNRRRNSDKPLDEVIDIREAIGLPDENDVFEKAMTQEAYERHVKSGGLILGFVALAKHLNNQKTSDDYINNLALPIYFKEGNPIYLVRWMLERTEDIQKIIIPYTESQVDSNNQNCTNDGFLDSKDDILLSESKFIKRVLVKEGSQVYKLEYGSSEELFEVYDAEEEQFVKYYGPTIIKRSNEFFKINKDGSEEPIQIDESKIIEFIS